MYLSFLYIIFFNYLISFAKENIQHPFKQFSTRYADYKTYLYLCGSIPQKKQRNLFMLQSSISISIYFSISYIKLCISSNLSAFCLEYMFKLYSQLSIIKIKVSSDHHLPAHDQFSTTEYTKNLCRHCPTSSNYR